MNSATTLFRFRFFWTTAAGSLIFFFFLLLQQEGVMCFQYNSCPHQQQQQPLPLAATTSTRTRRQCSHESFAMGSTTNKRAFLPTAACFMIVPSTGGGSGPGVVKRFSTHDPGAVTTSTSYRNTSMNTQRDVRLAALDTRTNLHDDAGESSRMTNQENRQGELPFPIAIIGWIVALSIFIVKNYASVDLWPNPNLADIPIPYLSLMHNLGNMIFAGSIITTAVLEWIVTESNDVNHVVPFWFDRVQKVERFLLLPALCLSVFSGVVRANLMYGTLKASPFYVKGTLHLLATFGLWWGITDRTTIDRVVSSRPLVKGNLKDVEKTDTDVTLDPKIVTIRRISNVISCVFLVAAYALMTLKPGIGMY